MSHTILFFGNERLATGVTTTAPVLQALLAAGYNVAAVVAAQGEASQSRRPRQLEVAQIASLHNIPILVLDDLKNAVDELSKYEAEIGVLAAYGNFVPAQIIDLFPKGIVNIHPSLLPKHRGSIPIESVILNGETETGVSLMQLANEMDAGPVYAQKRISLSGQETKQALSDQLSALGAELLAENLPAILDGTISPRPQDGEPTYDERITKQDGAIDWQEPAAQLVREVRAYAGWPRSRTKLGTTDVIVTAARHEDGEAAPGALKINGKLLALGTGDGLFVIERLIPSGKPEMTAEAFLAGYKVV